MSFNWPRSCRLREERAIQLVYHKGTRVKAPRSALFFLSSEDLRVAISVSRKTGNAVVRNRQKRLAREFFRLFREQFVQPCWMIIVIYRPYESLSDMTAELTEACQKAGLWACGLSWWVWCDFIKSISQDIFHPLVFIILHVLLILLRLCNVTGFLKGVFWLFYGFYGARDGFLGVETILYLMCFHGGGLWVGTFFSGSGGESRG